MRTLKQLALVAAVATAVVLPALPAVPARPASASVAIPASVARPGATAGLAGAAGLTGLASPAGCHAERTPAGWVVVCSQGGGTPGGGGSPGGGSGGGGGGDTCTLSSLPPGYPFPSPAPKGEKWMWVTCQMTEQTGLVLVPTGSTAGNPGVTPQQLEQWALADLTVPVPVPVTAPPRGDRGLVGLPEWVWMSPANWHPVSAQVTVGPVFAKVTAVPTTITISPGGGQRPVTCNGPGTAYNRALPAGGQHTDCSVTYTRSSDLQPGSTYRASVTVTWTASWVGSGGTGGAINPPLQETTTFGIRVAEGQALVSGGGQ